MQPKKKKIITGICFGSLFLFYLLISFLYVYCLDSIHWDYLLGNDSPRVLADWTDFYANHYRTKVHPLYVFLIYPIIWILTFIGLDSVMAVITLTAFVATINTYLVYKIITKLLPNKYILSILITVFFGLSFTVLENLMIIESFTFSLFTILVFWTYFTYHLQDYKLNVKNIIILLVLGVLCFSMLLTNFFHFLIGLLFLLVFNQKKSFKQYVIDTLKYLGIITGTVLLSFVFISLQCNIFKSAENAIQYVINMISDLFTGSRQTEEFSYIDTNITGSSFLNILIFFFGIVFTGGKIAKGQSLTISASWLTIVMIIAMSTLFCFSIYRIIKNKTYIAVPFIIAYIFEIILHLFYGNTELILYINQSSFLLLTIITLGLFNLDEKYKKATCIVAYSFIGFSLIQTIVSAIKLFIGVFQKFGLADRGFFANNYKFLLLVLLTGIFLASLGIWNYIRTHKQVFYTNVKDFIMKLFISLIMAILLVSAFVPFQNKGLSSEQLSQNIQVLPVANPNRVLMGMGQRGKYVLEKTEINYIFYKYDIETKHKTILLENLTNVEFNALNYTIKCLDEQGKQVSILENEIGIYLKKDNVVTTLDDSNYINIPSYEGYSYSDYLKILFYETMVNVLPNGFTPNYITYGNFWYRDGAIMAMVLEATNNLSQMRLDVDVDDVYDGARGGVDEPDNLGELLFMLSLQEEKNWPVINAVLAEAERIKQADNCIHGLTDGSDLYVYQTTWLKFGMERLGLDSSAYDVTNKVDGYSNMCWWYTRGNSNNYPYDIENMEKTLFDINTCWYPYLEIARLHYHEKQINLPTNLNYPISFEWQDWGLPQQAECTPHSWSSSELFLYLLDYDKF